MAPVLATFLLVSKALATQADSGSYVLDSGASQEQCHEDEATSLLQVKFAVKRSSGSDADNRTEASSRPGALQRSNGTDARANPFATEVALEPVPNPGTCSMVSVAAWASMEIYMSPSNVPIQNGISEKQDKQLDSWMQAAGWTRDDGLSVDAMDGIGFWTHEAKDDCILAFRGSDELVEALVQSSLPVSFPSVHGIMVQPGVGGEWEQYFAAMKEKVGGSDVYAQEGLKKYTDKCPGGIIAAGHSLGGGVAQLFAYLANKHGDPLKMKLPYAEGVKAVYSYGPLPVGYEPTGFLLLEKKELTNDKRADGCFPGGTYVNAQKTVTKAWGKTGTKQVYKQTGVSWQWKQNGWFGHWSLEPTYGYVSEDTWGWVDKEKREADWIPTAMGGQGNNWHVKGPVHLLYDNSPSGTKTYQCGDTTPWWNDVKAKPGDIHMMDRYSNKIGCM